MAPKRSNKKQKHAKQQKQTALQHRPDPSVACFALHPSKNFVAIAVNDVVRISSIKKPSGPKVQITQTYAAPIRAVAFDATGKFFLSAGDEKLVKVWDTDSWGLIQTIQSPKKVTAAIFSNDSSLVVFADKFGDVLTAKLQPGQSQEGSAAPLLGHLCSIVTSLAFTPDGKQLVSTDQDCKVRVSTMPAEPQQGAHSIQSICMGHTVFAKCCAFLSHRDGAQPLLLSGGGDSTIRSWRHLTGKQLDCFTCISEDAQKDPLEDAAPVSSVTATAGDGGVAAASATLQSDAAKQDLGDDEDAEMDAAHASKAPEDGAQRGSTDMDAADLSEDDMEPEDLEKGEDEGEEGEAAGAEGSGQPAVLSITAAPDGSTVAAAVEGRDTILILQCDFSSGKLAQQQEVQLPGLSLPTQVQFDAEGRLWAVGGPLSGSMHAACIGVAVRSGTGSDRQWQHDESVLSGDVKAALENTEAGSQTQEALPNAATNQQQVNQQLRKRIYSTAEREARKKNRNDMKE